MSDTNAILDITVPPGPERSQPAHGVRIPVTWDEGMIVEGEELFEKIFQDEGIVDWTRDSSPDMDVILDADPDIRSRVYMDAEAMLIYPNQAVSTLQNWKRWTSS